jgi:hypothetical protein
VNAKTALRYHSKKAFPAEDIQPAPSNLSRQDPKARLNSSALQNLDLLSPSKSCSDINSLLNLELEAFTFLCNVIPKSEQIEQSIVKSIKKTSDFKKSKRSRHSKSQEGYGQMQPASMFTSTPEFCGT